MIYSLPLRWKFASRLVVTVALFWTTFWKEEKTRVNNKFSNLILEDTWSQERLSSKKHFVLFDYRIFKYTPNYFKTHAEGIVYSLRFKSHDSVWAVFECVRGGYQSLALAVTKQRGGGKTYLPLPSLVYVLKATVI